MNSEVYLDTVVIGSGILGLSIAYYISKKFPNMTIAVLEKNPTFGVETSSRNSEVIHAGIYYKKNSLKAKYCKLGKEMIYDICKKNSIQFNKCGKFIVINNDEQYSNLIQIKENAFYNDVDLKYLDKNEMSNIENLSHFNGALWSSETGDLPPIL
ncbi:NAD(P)/FAD-dependent oxidoreductase [Silvanigrella sp.]|jgi:2-hydroxyglutarate dehydrogenase|uniref:NAD(P)/FAD-dependent oxidoreductase n=1 Tax=Silvanigrella sp. TaxID=2024976 RepID=UPI0037C7AABA